MSHYRCCSDSTFYLSDFYWLLTGVCYEQYYIPADTRPVAA